MGRCWVFPGGIWDEFGVVILGGGETLVSMQGSKLALEQPQKLKRYSSVPGMGERYSSSLKSKTGGVHRVDMTSAGSPSHLFTA
jgi:hypothetical protein